MTEECFICKGKGYYKDTQGVWHKCPKCNRTFPDPKPTDTGKPTYWWYGSTINPDTQVTTSNQECKLDACAERIRKEQGLHKGAIIPLMMYCPCPKCSPRFRC